MALNESETVFNNPETSTYHLKEFLDNPLTNKYINQSKDIFILNQKDNNPALFMIINNKLVTGETEKSTGLSEAQINNFRWSNKFILSSIQESRNEKIQVFETFGKPSIFFFGERVRMYNISGYLVESKVPSDQQHNPYNKNWSDNFKRFYDEHFRGSILAKYNQIAVISVTDNLIFGYPISLSITEASDNPMLFPFTMGFLVVKHTLPNSANPDGSVIQMLYNTLNMDAYIRQLNIYQAKQTELYAKVSLSQDDPKRNQIPTASKENINAINSKVDALQSLVATVQNQLQTFIMENSAQLNNDLTPDKTQGVISDLQSRAVNERQFYDDVLEYAKDTPIEDKQLGIN